MDVAASEGHRYNITFYCVDFDGAHIREAIKVHRGDMGVAAPMVLLLSLIHISEPTRPY